VLRAKLRPCNGGTIAAVITITTTIIIITITIITPERQAGGFIARRRPCDPHSRHFCFVLAAAPKMRR
jgi:hypothetical protein